MCSHEDHMHTGSSLKRALICVSYSSLLYEITNILYIETVVCFSEYPVCVWMQ